ncbi:MAG: hypothetical protein J7M24_01465, partial [Candidatus Latescibacteria bacterium]|nr:hypothetical protein [Candidatus Latescibacterota bacterium]
MRAARLATVALLGVCVLAVPFFANAQPTKELKQIFPKMYLATGLDWQGESMQNTCWNKICEDKQGR